LWQQFVAAKEQFYCSGYKESMISISILVKWNNEIKVMHGHILNDYLHTKRRNWMCFSSIFYAHKEILNETMVVDAVQFIWALLD
jgi:hypothetical protein